MAILEAISKIGSSYNHAMHSSANKNEPILVVGKMKISLADEERREFLKLTNTLFERTETLDHPLTYSCSESIQRSGEFVWNEVWVSKESLDNHLASSHFQNWWKWVEPKLKEPLNVVYVELAKTKKI